MVGIRKRGEIIRQFLLESVVDNPDTLASIAASEFNISRQAINKHIKILCEQGALEAFGTTRDRKYTLKSQNAMIHEFSLSTGIGEDEVWRDYVRPLFNGFPENILDIWHYGVTEIFNNAIDHSSADTVKVVIQKTAKDATVYIIDNGEGIFKKIQRELDLADERHSVLELAKGKLTTDPANHSGEGIFFSSRMFDKFNIMSGNVHFTHEHEDPDDWIFEPHEAITGTVVLMRIANNSARRMKNIFDKYTTDDDYGFNKTVVPVRMAQYGDDKLVSRSQAKRLLSRVDRFKVVIFDFKEVETIGQAFADEIFRVFSNRHPEIKIVPVNETQSIKDMISRAKHV